MWCFIITWHHVHVFEGTQIPGFPFNSEQTKISLKHQDLWILFWKGLWKTEQKSWNRRYRLQLPFFRSFCEQITLKLSIVEALVASLNLTTAQLRWCGELSFFTFDHHICIAEDYGTTPLHHNQISRRFLEDGQQCPLIHCLRTKGPHPWKWVQHPVPPYPAEERLELSRARTAASGRWPDIWSAAWLETLDEFRTRI